MANIIGTDRSDVLQGTWSWDTIYGNGGNDNIFGGGGDDMLSGRLGDDSLFGGAGNGKLFGGKGNDLIEAGIGNNQVWGGAGSDVIVLAQSQGRDTINVARGDATGLGDYVHFFNPAEDDLRMGTGISQRTTTYEHSGNNTVVHFGTLGGAEGEGRETVIFYGALLTSADFLWT